MMFLVEVLRVTLLVLLTRKPCSRRRGSGGRRGKRWMVREVWLRCWEWGRGILWVVEWLVGDL